MSGARAAHRAFDGAIPATADAVARYIAMSPVKFQDPPPSEPPRRSWLTVVLMILLLLARRGLFLLWLQQTQPG